MNASTVIEFRLKLYPRDFTKVRAFYEQVLGFEAADEWDRGETDRGAMFRVGPAILELLSPEEGYRVVQGAGLSLEVPDVRILWSELQTKAEVIFELRDNSWGDASFCIADPEGFKLTFFSKSEELK
ncbi:MAG TPA: VOC family protein [Candidatus Saccharimonadales bacterium]|nr:VOC family protein [Candidatus Saccharimonadales bacterium]